LKPAQEYRQYNWNRRIHKENLEKPFSNCETDNAPADTMYYQSVCTI